MTVNLEQNRISIHVTDVAGTTREIAGDIGTSLMEIIKAAGIDDIPAFCGGVCSCASCHVVISPDFAGLLPAMSEDEADLLDGSAHRAEGSRLSCQVKASSELDGLCLTIAPQE